MSGLPKYTRMPDLESGEADSLVKGGRNSFDETVPSYPPQGESSSTSVGHNVTYTFEPIYPVKGKKRHVMGRLGTTREVSLGIRCGTSSEESRLIHQETIDVVRRAFPEVAKYPDSRIEFEVGIDGSKEDWGGLMDDAWSQFATQAPSRIKVTVADGPGDARRRKSGW